MSNTDMNTKFEPLTEMYHYTDYMYNSDMNNKFETPSEMSYYMNHIDNILSKLYSLVFHSRRNSTTEAGPVISAEGVNDSGSSSNIDSNADSSSSSNIDSIADSRSSSNIDSISVNNLKKKTLKKKK